MAQPYLPSATLFFLQNPVPEYYPFAVSSHELSHPLSVESLLPLKWWPGRARSRLQACWLGGCRRGGERVMQRARRGRSAGRRERWRSGLLQPAPASGGASATSGGQVRVVAQTTSGEPVRAARLAPLTDSPMPKRSRAQHIGAHRIPHHRR